MPQEAESQAREDVTYVWLSAANCVLHEDRVGKGSNFESIQAVVDSYAADVLRHVGPDTARLYAAARIACHDAADHVDEPKAFRVAMRTVSLLQRAAELASE